MNKKDKYYIYILKCSDGSLYIGWSHDVDKRLALHNAGRGAKYTRSRLPVKLVYSQVCSSKQDAMRQEREIKKLSRAQKLSLIWDLIPGTVNF
jgi:predicted GIY-YIG superfamily endonuclease